MLSDTLIRYAMRIEGSEPHRLDVTPVPEDVQFQPASLDLRLGNEFKHFVRPLNPTNAAPLDPTRPYPTEWMETTTVASIDGAESFFVLVPGVFTLATTLERVKMPVDLVARVEGKSSLGRLGLIIHATAGFVDPGFRGNITLEMMNLGPRPIALKIGMRICQLSFEKVDGRVERPYGHPDLKSKYQGQTGVTESRAHKDGGAT
jgi:dCTP deaminase